jgi:ribonuclease G
MPGELLIAAGPGEWRAAWLENGQPVELYIERGDTKPPGSIHLGRVTRVVPGLDAMFVDIGDERPALLRVRDAPAAHLAEGARVVAQIRREARQDKAPLLTGKIDHPDLTALLERAGGIDPPAQLLPAPGLAAALALRTPDVPQRIVADDAAIVVALRAAFPDVAIARESEPAFDVDTLCDEALAATLPLNEGGRVHIEELRAATLIDVDTGTPETGAAERLALAANLGAAELIARQLRLRNISGPIVVDFVGLDRRDHRERVRQAFAAALSDDRAKPEVLGWTRLGHLELVRPRRGRSLADAMLEPRGPVKRPVAIAHEALRRLLREARANPAAGWRLAVTAEVEAMLRGPTAPALRALETRLGRRVAVTIDPAAGRGFDIAPS